MKYKFLFTDIDGTLLNKEREITPAVKQEIGRISRNLKVPVTLVSSRMPKAMSHLQAELKLNGPMICYNGALIISSPEDDPDILFSRLLSSGIVKTIYKEARKLNLHTSLYSYDDWFVEELDFWAYREIISTRVHPSVTPFDELIKLWEDENSGAHKIMCMGDGSAIDGLIAALDKNYDGILNLYRSKPSFLEITSKRITKASAVEFLLKMYGADSREAVAVGDNYNDTDMLLYAGAGVAMGNAPLQVKEAADEVTLPNTEDGLAEAIKRFFPRI